MKIFLLIFTFTFSLTLTTAGQETQSGAIRTKDGYLLISNEPGNFYTMEVMGKTLTPVPDHFFWFTVDGKFLQVVNAERSQFLEGASDKGLDDKALLSAHFKWESDYIAETLKTKLKLDTEWVKLTNGMTALAWGYNMPRVAEKQTAKRQLYLILLNGTHAVGLNTVVETDGEDKALRQFLIDTMNTFKPLDKPLALEDARQQILKAN